MKKLLVIICVLLIIFIGMYIYKSNVNKNIITASEVDKIEEYLSKIYMWQEITDQALPTFNDINEAPDKWVWEVVKKNLENYELSYEEIQKKAVEIFGNNFKKNFPAEGTEYIYYNQENKKYFSTGIGLDTLEDNFFIKEIKKINNGYEVKIVEYLEDYGNVSEVDVEEQMSKENNNTEASYDINIMNLENNTIATIKNTDTETKKIEVIKENIDKFSTKIVVLRQVGRCKFVSHLCRKLSNRGIKNDSKTR